MPNTALTTTCCIAGGGPAGMMLGFLLARAGVDVIVLEKHGDFLRDFRGDTIHPSTLELMHELGLLDEFLTRPHQKVYEVTAQFGSERITVADFRHLPTRCKFLAFMPQWDFLDFLADHAKRLPAFRLMMNAEVTALIEEGGRINGLHAATPEGAVTMRAELVVGADGRHSIVRAQAGLVIDDLGAPMDVLWLRISRRPDDVDNALGHLEAGRLFVMLDRGDYWQCAYVIPKGDAEPLRARGLDAFRADIRALSPWLGARVDEIDDWDKVKLLTVAVDRLRQWSRPGLLCIGDAAHAMSPIGGVGINLAVQDAVAAANILAGPLARRALAPDDLARVQRRRQWPTRLTQAGQVFIQNRIITPLLEGREAPKPPWPVRLAGRFPLLRRLPARLVGLGLRPENIRNAARPILPSANNVLR